MARQIWQYGRFYNEAPTEQEGENRRPKKMCAEEQLKAEIRQKALKGRL